MSEQIKDLNINGTEYEIHIPKERITDTFNADEINYSSDKTVKDKIDDLATNLTNLEQKVDSLDETVENIDETLKNSKLAIIVCGLLAKDSFGFYADEDCEISWTGTIPNIMFAIDSQKATDYSQWDGGIIALSQGEYVTMFGENSGAITGSMNNHFIMSGKIRAFGDITRLITKDGTDTITIASCFRDLF